MLKKQILATKKDPPPAGGLGLRNSLQMDEPLPGRHYRISCTGLCGGLTALAPAGAFELPL
nr:hypothetical protein [uncultured archaeon]